MLQLLLVIGELMASLVKQGVFSRGSRVTAAEIVPHVKELSLATKHALVSGDTSRIVDAAKSLRKLESDQG